MFSCQSVLCVRLGLQLHACCLACCMACMWLCVHTQFLGRSQTAEMSWQPGVYGDVHHGAMQTMHMHVAHAAMLMYPCRKGVVTSTTQAHILPCFGTDYSQAAISLADMDHAVCTQVLPIRLPMYPILGCGETSSTACLNKVSVCFKVCCGNNISTCPIIDFLSLFSYSIVALIL